MTKTADMEYKQERRKTFGDTEHLFSGTLTLGEQKKEGTQIAFKGKDRRFYVLRCLSERFLTLSGYRSMKEYKTAQAGNPYKSVEQVVVTQHAKIHSMHLPSKKRNKQSNVLCIIQEKKTIYFEAETNEDLQMWMSVFDDAFVRLGWTEPPASPEPPSPSPEPVPTAPMDEVAPSLAPKRRPASMDRVRISSPTATRNVFDLFQETAEDARVPSRHSSGSLGTRYPSPLDHYDWPKSTSSELRRVVQPASETAAGNGVLGRDAPSRDSHGLIESTYATDERVVDLHEYVNVRSKPELVACPRPPALPPRSLAHRRGRTCPDVVMAPSSYSSVASEAGESDGDDRPPGSSPPPPPVAARRSPRHSVGERPPRISVTEPLSPPQQLAASSPSLLGNRRFQHLFDESDEACQRKVSLPQPLAAPQHRRRGVVSPPAYPLGESPPDSPAQMRKAGSYSNLALNLSSRPLPSPTNDNSFDVQTLRWEMGHMNGFAIALDKHELQDALGLVAIADYVWVAGWKTGKPELAKKLHIGDQLRQIDEQIVVDPSITNALFAKSAVDEIIIILRRLPYGKVRYLHRTSTSEGWGLEVEGNRILNVSMSGPAAEAKLTTRAEGAFSERLCDWIITEIDGEPVSLFSKRDQVKNRMDNAGLDMALVIQPDDFVRRLKAELEKVRFAHEYIVG